ncbi:AAA family ATPase [Streptomyces sp. NPDC052051]|uniref:helix-turn-helix transcriptional regulator n=1 Tax=Streptomyces sp. NPDC052051 TaxID=3154649 RepID=UPI00344290A1
MIAKLIGKEADMERLDSAFARVTRGVGSLFLVQGPPGCGKSTLLDSAVERARARGATAHRLYTLARTSGQSLDALRELAELPDLSAEARDRLGRALDKNASPQASAAVRRAALACFVELVSGGPAVIALDDIDDMDRASLDVLLHVVHQLRDDAVVFLLSACTFDLPHARYSRNSLLRLPWADHIRLRRWGRGEVAMALAHCTGRSAPRSLVDKFLAITNGNPVLVQAAVEDHRDLSGGEPTGAGPLRPQVGGAFDQAFLACVRRAGSFAQSVAVALAVLGADASLPLLALLLSAPKAAVAKSLQTLEDGGLVRGLHFSHSAAATLILDDADPELCAQLHGRTAQLLHNKGADAAAAGHLVRSGTLDADWQLPVLEAAAQRALERDDAHTALELLDFALRAWTDERARSRLAARLAVVASRVDPAAAEEHLTVAVSAALAGSSFTADSELLVNSLLLNGRAEDALNVLGLKDERPAVSRIKTHAATMWSALVGLPHTKTTEEDDSGALPLGEPALLVATPLWSPGGLPQAEAAARLLETSPLTDALIPALANAIKVLTFTDRVAEAREWAHRLLQEAEYRNVVGWELIFLVLQAEIALFQGNLPVAQSLAARVAQESPTSMIGVGARSLQILAHTGMGQYVAASHLLDQPVPSHLFGTVNGLGYLFARGRFYLATGSLHEALDDFRSIGRLAASWGIDNPALLPWRLVAAEAALRVGEREHAEHLLTEQAKAGATANSRTSGAILRLRAEMAHPGARPPLLYRAIELLQLSGDRYELARAYVCFTQTFEQLNLRQRAVAMRQAASALADECHALPLKQELRSQGAIPQQRTPGPAWPGPPSTTPSELSTSELRVAVLASRGLTNREISANLFITVSTVEQHLTRVYRKLGISRREDLALNLPESA